MADAFGHKWTSSYGLTPNKGWVDGLADMTIDDIKVGLANMKGWHDDEGWPPNLMQFRELCKPRSAPAHEIYKPLPAPTSSPEARKNAAELAFSTLREGVLKPAKEERKFSLTEEEKALSEQLDWERIDRVGKGEFLPPPEKKIDAKASASGCTCPLESVPGPNGSEFLLVISHSCDYCREWDRKISELGLTEKGAADPDAGQRKSKVRKAA